jgi:hypothetical protein
LSFCHHDGERADAASVGFLREAKPTAPSEGPADMATPSAESLRHRTLRPIAFTQRQLRVAAQHRVGFRGSSTDFGVLGVAFPLRRGAEARSTRAHRSHKENRQERRLQIP